MRNIFKFFAVALAILAAVSCEKNEVPGNELSGEPITLTASITNGGTRTSLGDWDNAAGEFPVLWSKADEIAVIQGSNVFKFVLVSGEGTTSGVFICENHEGFQASQAFQAFYPYRDNLLNEDGNVDFEVVARQNHLTNTFNIDVAPMAAYSASGTSITFANLFSVLKLQLKGKTETVRSIEVTSMTNANLCGPAVFSFSEGGMPALKGWKWNNSSTRTVILDCGEGVQLKTDEPTDFMIMIPPGVGQGWAIVIKTDENTYYKSSSQSHDVASGKILGMQSLDLSPSGNVNKLTAKSYVENSVYLGEGIQIGNLLWAPVNCGYEKAIGSYKGYTWGKLYQWGASGGIGYSTDYDVTGEGINNYHSYSSNAWSNNNNNPCPDGWRVPTSEELGSLLRSSDLETDGNGKQGYWFGTSVDDRKVFFQAAGEKSNNLGGAGRGQNCCYWSATSLYYENGSQMYCMYDSNNVLVDGISQYQYFKEAASVRCVKDVD